MKYILIIIAFLFVAAVAYPSDDCTFKVQLNNDTDGKINYTFNWFDHNFGYSGSANMAGGELQAKETNDLKYDYKCGIYWVRWIYTDKSCVYAFSQNKNSLNPRILTPCR